MSTDAKILVIDDDPDIGLMLKLILEFKGYSALVADTAELAMEMLENSKFDVIIMDMLLSGANGTDICVRIRKDPHTQHIPILMISAHPNAKELCLQAGADDFILKPFEMADILGRLKQLLQKVA